MTEPLTEPDRHWLERVDAIGATQGRYLWALLIVMLFYAALQVEAVSGRPASVKVPIVDLQLSTIVVLSSGPGVLSLIVLAIVGSMRALRRGREQGLDSRTGEEFDRHPNVIDLAFYAAPGSASFFAPLPRLVYAVFLSLGLTEGVWLSCHMLARHAVDGWPPSYIVVVEVLGALLWFRAVWLVSGVWSRSIREYWTLYRK
jgi:hypothetical protein